MKRKLGFALALSVLPVLGLLLVDLYAHQDKQTLVAADAAKTRGITTLRVTMRNGGFWPEDGTYPDESQVRVQLLAPENKHLGNFRETLYWRKVWDSNMKQEPSMTYGDWKNHLVGQEYQLEWNGERLKVEMRTDEHSVTVWYNGKQILAATIDVKTKKAETRPNDNLKDVEDRQALIQLATDIEKDLRAALMQPPKLISCCGPGGSGEVVCNGMVHYGDGTALNQTQACLNAHADANLNCWNQYCTGCCEFYGDDPACVLAYIGLPFFCSCQTTARSCSCKQGYI